MSVGQDNDHSVAVYNVENASLVASAKGNKAKVNQPNPVPSKRNVETTDKDVTLLLCFFRFLL